MFKKYLSCVAIMGAMFANDCIAGDPFMGGKVYNEHCVMCHGANGKAVMAGTPDFLHTQILAKPDYKIKAFIEAGKGIMPSYKGILKDQQILDVISYIRTFH